MYNVENSLRLSVMYAYIRSNETLYPDPLSPAKSGAAAGTGLFIHVLSFALLPTSETHTIQFVPITVHITIEFH